MAHRPNVKLKISNCIIFWGDTDMTHHTLDYLRLIIIVVSYIILYYIGIKNVYLNIFFLNHKKNLYKNLLESNIGNIFIK